jgi:hypothetical protein
MGVQTETPKRRIKSGVFLFPGEFKAKLVAPQLIHSKLLIHSLEKYGRPNHATL